MANDQEIYARSASCKDWKESGATIVIEEESGELVVTDGLPSESGGP